MSIVTDEFNEVTLNSFSITLVKPIKDNEQGMFKGLPYVQYSEWFNNKLPKLGGNIFLEDSRVMDEALDYQFPICKLLDKELMHKSKSNTRRFNMIVKS